MSATDLAFVVDDLQTKYNLSFLVKGGGQLHGFSDYELFGVYLAPTSDVLGLYKIKQEIDDNCRLMEFGAFVKRCAIMSANYLELLFAPSHLILTSKPYMDTLRKMTNHVISKSVARSYQSLVTNHTNDLRTYLNSIRALMAAIHVLETGQIVSNIFTLYKKRFVDYEIINDLANSGAPLNTQISADAAQHVIDSLQNTLSKSYQESRLAENVTSDEYIKFNELVVDVRKRYG